MQKTPVTREEVAKQLVSDAFFEKNHLALVLRQSLITLLAWIGVILPFIWLAIPFLYPKLANRFHFRTYFEEIFTFDYLGIFLSCSFLVITLLFISLTIKNNLRFKHSLRQDTLHDEDLLNLRKEALEKLYSARFGAKEFRESVRYYSVNEKQNLDTNEIEKHYREQGAEL